LWGRRRRRGRLKLGPSINHLFHRSSEWTEEIFIRSGEKFEDALHFRIIQHIRIRLDTGVARISQSFSEPAVVKLINGAIETTCLDKIIPDIVGGIQFSYSVTTTNDSYSFFNTHSEISHKKVERFI
jgi:hypothetical protein